MSGPQLALALRFPADQRFGDFSGSPLALQLLRRLAEDAVSEWIFLSGPTASGKTHVLLATAAHASELGQRVAYLPLADARGTLRALLAQQEHADLVALDDLDAIAGERADEVALFDFHNRARAAGARVVYAASTPCAALSLELPDLRSRLAQCTQVSLDPLDESQRRELLRRRAQRRGLSLDDAVLDYLFSRVGRDLGSLSRLLDRLDRASLAAQRRITLPFLRSVLEADEQG